MQLEMTQLSKINVDVTGDVESCRLNGLFPQLQRFVEQYYNTVLIDSG
jgi:hypothetical protein